VRLSQTILTIGACTETSSNSSIKRNNLLHLRQKQSIQRDSRNLPMPDDSGKTKQRTHLHGKLGKRRVSVSQQEADSYGCRSKKAHAQVWYIFHLRRTSRSLPLPLYRRCFTLRYQGIHCLQYAPNTKQLLYWFMWTYKFFLTTGVELYGFAWVEAYNLQISRPRLTQDERKA